MRPPTHDARIAALENALLDLLARVQELEARSDKDLRARYLKAEDETTRAALRKMIA